MCRGLIDDCQHDVARWLRRAGRGHRSRFRGLRGGTLADAMAGSEPTPGSHQSSVDGARSRDWLGSERPPIIAGRCSWRTAWAACFRSNGRDEIRKLWPGCSWSPCRIRLQRRSLSRTRHSHGSIWGMLCRCRLLSSQARMMSTAGRSVPPRLRGLSERGGSRWGQSGTSTPTADLGLGVRASTSSRRLSPVSIASRSHVAVGAPGRRYPYRWVFSWLTLLRGDA